MDYSKPIYFRPNEQDAAALELLGQQHPNFSESGQDLLRLALEEHRQVTESTKSVGVELERLPALLNRFDDRLRSEGFGSDRAFQLVVELIRKIDVIIKDKT